MEYLFEIILSVVTALTITVLTGVLAHFKKENKRYKELLAEKKDDCVRAMIHEEIKPLEEELGRLAIRLQEAKDAEAEHIAIIQGSYKFRLIHLCRTYIRQGYITEEQFESLSEFYRVYTSLGGNGQAAEYYDRVLALPMHN